MSRLERLLTRLFAVERMDGDGLCPLYLTRWTLWRGLGRGLYLHKFTGSDWAVDLHDHPRRFVSFGLRGRYVEQLPDGRSVEWRAPWARAFPAEHRHRVAVYPGEVAWTLVYAGRKSRPWGFWLFGRWLPWREYLERHGRDRRAC